MEGRIEGAASPERGMPLGAPKKDASLDDVQVVCCSPIIGEGQKGTPGRGRDRKCHDRASLSRPLVLSLGPLTSLTSSPLLCTS